MYTLTKKSMGQLINKLDECEKLLDDLEEFSFFRDNVNSSFNDLKERFEYISNEIEYMNHVNEQIEVYNTESIADEIKHEIALKLVANFSLEEMIRLEKLI